MYDRKKSIIGKARIFGITVRRHAAWLVMPTSDTRDEFSVYIPHTHDRYSRTAMARTLKAVLCSLKTPISADIIIFGIIKDGFPFYIDSSMLCVIIRLASMRRFSSGGAKVLGKLPVPGRPTNLD